MKIIRLVKQLNNTETGNGNTHESYILIPSDLDVSDLFETRDEPIDFYDLSSGELFQIRKTVGRETRIVGFGDYYSMYDLAAGDEIILEKVIKKDSIEYTITNFKNKNSIVAQKLGQNFEILRGIGHQVEWHNIDNSFSVEFVEKKKKRSDSPVMTDIYKLIVKGNDIDYKYKYQNMVILDLENNKVNDRKSYAWKKYVFEMED